MDAELNLDDILMTDEIDDLFSGATGIDEDDSTEEESEKEEIKETETTEETTEESEDPESVGSEENISENQEDPSSESEATSSNTVFSSLAKALAVEGVFPDLTDEEAGKITSSQDFRTLIENQIKAGLEEELKRISEALNAGVEPDEISQYTKAISYLDSISEEAITDESEKGETLRKQLIYQDFINRGYSKERALREIKKSFDTGSDIDDAKEALKGNKDYFQSQYDSLIEDSKKEQEKIKKERLKQADELKKSILESKEVFKDIEVDKATRTKIYDNISKPVYKDKESGNYYTAILKYQKENPTDFIKNVGLLFTLTDGFKNIDKIVKPKVNKALKNGLKDLELTLNNTSRNSDGSLKLFSGSGGDENSIFRGYELDI